MTHAHHDAEVVANKIKSLLNFADEQFPADVDLTTNQVSAPSYYEYLDDGAQAQIDTKMTVLEGQIPRLLADGEQVDTELARVIAVAAGLPEPQADHGDPGSSTGAPPPGQPKQVPGPKPADPPYATGLTPTLAGDPNDNPPMKVDPGSSDTVQLTDNPPGYTGGYGPERDQAWLAYLSHQDGATPGVVSKDLVLPNPEAVSNPGLKTVGAAARQQGVSYAWGAGHPGPPDTTTPAPPGVSKGNLNRDDDGKAAYWGDENRTGFDCSGLARFATSQGHPGLDISKGTWGDTISQYRTLTADGGVGTKIYNGADLKPGDVLYFGPEGGSHHVAIYAGNGLMIQAAQSGAPVEVSPIYTEGHVGVHIND